MFNLPTKKELEKPDDMPEKYWGLIFDAHMKRHDSFFSGMVFGFCINIFYLLLLALFS